MLLCFSFLLASGFVYAEEVTTNVGQVQITENQMLNYAPSGVWKRFSYVDGVVYGVSEGQPSQNDIDALISQLSTLPDTVPQSVILSRFDSERAIGREAQVFSAIDMVRFAPIGYNINELIRFKNFWGGVTEGNVPYVGLKQFCQAAIASGTGMFTQNDYDRLNGILKEQGIDLDYQG